MTEPEASTAVGTEVLSENESIRVSQMILAPGETCPPHRHLHDHVILYAEPATIRTELDGRPVIQHVEDGCVSYRAVGPRGLPPHSITNAADRPSRHFILELLGPSASDAPTAHQHNGRARTEALT
jgi:beta-alanine degradation protein BauB